MRKSELQSHVLQKLKQTVIVRFIMAILVLGLILFLPAGTIYYWEAWVYILIMFVPVAIVGLYLYRNDPKLLERRMRTRETQRTQKLVNILSLLFFIPAFIVPGLDKRFAWSQVPLYIIVVSDFMVLSGYLLSALVLKTNSYASRVIEVEKNQKVISTGPYAVVRHPMYLGMLVIFAFSPLALGSYWAVLPVIFLPLTLVLRIRGEEKELTEHLEGYKEYIARTKYRLLPGIW